MRMKLSPVIVSIFVLLLTNCSLFEDPAPVNINGPKEGDILVKGDSFYVFADIHPEYGMDAVSVRLTLIPEDSTYHSTFIYNRKLLECILWEEGISIQGDVSIAKELMVPLDAPVNDNYDLRVEIGYQGGGSGYVGAVPVKIRSSNE